MSRIRLHRRRHPHKASRSQSITGTVRRRVRRKFFIDVYSLALYAERRFKDGESFIAATGPRRAQLTFLRDVDRARGEAAWREAIERAMEADERERLAADIARFAALFPAVKKGDTITLELSRTRRCFAQS